MSAKFTGKVLMYIGPDSYRSLLSNEDLIYEMVGTDGILGWSNEKFTDFHGNNYGICLGDLKTLVKGRFIPATELSQVLK